MSVLTASATDVMVLLDQLGASPATNRSITVQKLQPFPGNLDDYSSGTNTWFGITNAAIGDYAVVIKQRGSAQALNFMFTVTATDLGVIGAHTNLSVLGTQTYPTTGKAAWSIAAADSRYSTLAYTLALSNQLWLTIQTNGSGTYTNNSGYAGQVVGSGIGTNVTRVAEAAAQSVARNVGGVTTNLVLGSGSPSGFMDHVYIWTNGAYFQLQAAGTLGSYYLTNFSDLWWHSAGTFTGGLTSLTNDTLTGDYSAAAGPLNFVHIELGLNGLAIAPSSINTNSFDAATRALLGTGSGGGSSNYVDLLVSTNFFQVRETNSGRVTITLHATNLPGANVTGVVSNATTAVTTTNVAAGVTNQWRADIRNVTNKSYHAQQALYFTNVTAGGYVNAVSALTGTPGMFGFTFRPRTNITVTSLSRWIVSGNTQKHDLVIVRTNDSALIAHTQIDTTQFPTNALAFVELPDAVELNPSEWYFVGSGEYTGGDNFPQNSGGWSTGWASNSCIQFGFGSPEGYFPVGFSGWNAVTYAVNFRFIDTAEKTLFILRDGTLPASENVIPAKKTFPGIVKANEFEGSAMDLTAQTAAIDLGPFTSPGGPTMGVDGYGGYYGNTNGYGNGGLPNITDVIRFSHALRTNGMAENYSVFHVDDGWYYSVNVTNGNRLVDFEQLQNSTSPRYIADAYFVRSNGVLQANPVNFPGGIAQAIQIVHTNGLRWRHYMPFRTNLSEFAQDIDYATKAGADEIMLDTTVGRQPNYLTGNSIRNYQRLIRTYQDATIKARVDSRGFYYTNENTYMQLHVGAHSNSGADHMNYLTNVTFTADHINGAAGYILNGSDPTNLLSVVEKVRATWPWRRFMRRGHYPDFLSTTWDTQSTNTIRSYFNTYMMGAGSWLINLGAVIDQLGANQHILTNREFYVYAQDPAVIPAYSVYTNGLKEIWTRSFGSTNSGTNLIGFLNLTTTNADLTITAAMLNQASNQPIAIRDIWMKTNHIFTNSFTFTAPPTNHHVFATWPQQWRTIRKSWKDVYWDGSGPSLGAPSSPAIGNMEVYYIKAANVANYFALAGLPHDATNVVMTYFMQTLEGSVSVAFTNQCRSVWYGPARDFTSANSTVVLQPAALNRIQHSFAFPLTNAPKSIFLLFNASTNSNNRYWVLDFELTINPDITPP